MILNYFSSLRCSIVTSVSILFACVTMAVSAQTTSHINDPLSYDEISKISLLTSNTIVNTISGSSLVAKASSDEDLNALTNTSQEILLIERNEEKGAPKDQRRADVYIYDYSTNELITSLVDLTTSEVIKSERKQDIQLPLTNKELARAKQIVFDDEDERAILEDEYRRITSLEMTNVDDLNIKAFTFHADSLPNRVNEASKECGIHRCAQLMLYTQENIVFEISPIINLSEGIVTQRIGF